MIRYELQSELYGLTQNQRNTVASTVLAALDNGQIVGTAVVGDRNWAGGPLAFVEASFTSRTEGDRIFDVCINWARTRATDGTGGVHSYVRLKEVNDSPFSILTRYAESPGWVETTFQEE